MKKFTYLVSVISLVLCFQMAEGQTTGNQGQNAREDVVVGTMPSSMISAGKVIETGTYYPSGGKSTMLYDNGSYTNRPGPGGGAPDTSVLQSVSNLMNSIGFGAQLLSGNRLADDLLVPAVWTIDSIIFFAYQTNSTTTSTITGLNLAVWDGIPEVGSMVWGDAVNSILANTYFSNVYRVTETTSGNTARPIMRCVAVTSGLTLNAGTYWLDWQFDGSLSSGPWNPPITIDGQVITGDGMQKTTLWAPVADGGDPSWFQGFPFIVYGTDVSGIKDASSQVKVNIGPNPAHGLFTVNSAENISVLQVYDILGNLVLSLAPASKQVQINCSGWISGLYLVKTTTKEKISVAKVTVD